MDTWLETNKDVREDIEKKNIQPITWDYSSDEKGAPTSPVQMSIIFEKTLNLGHLSVPIPGGSALCVITALPFMEDSQIRTEIFPIFVGVTVGGQFSGAGYSSGEESMILSTEEEAISWIEARVGMSIRTRANISMEAAGVDYLFQDSPKEQLNWSLLEPYVRPYLVKLSNNKFMKEVAGSDMTPDIVELRNWIHANSSRNNTIGIFANAIRDP